ncbi:uncharacterized protein LOC135337965 isoform X2 [Halichondria panicea]|uniref:uncharacterized protein LOC135337965 isoform X2 n=1 Tax=Halichondria panicea TaxID=6063 RepID=UPI00312BA085
MSAIKVYILLSLSVLCITNGQGQGQRCLDGFPSVTDNTCTLSTCPIQGISSSRQLRLFPSMRITCNGMLVGLSVAGETLSGGDYPILQIWRPTGPTPNDYERISEYTFPIGCTQLPNNVWQCRVNSIDVEERDIIGIDLPLAIKTVAAFGMYSMSPPSFTSYTLSSTTERTFSVPVSAITDSAQPLLTLDIQEQGTRPYTKKLAWDRG